MGMYGTTVAGVYHELHLLRQRVRARTVEKIVDTCFPLHTFETNTRDGLTSATDLSKSIPCCNHQLRFAVFFSATSPQRAI